MWLVCPDSPGCKQRAAGGGGAQGFDDAGHFLDVGGVGEDLQGVFQRFEFVLADQDAGAHFVAYFDADAVAADLLEDPAQTPLKIALDQWQIVPGAKSIVFRNATDNALWQLTFRA